MEEPTNKETLADILGQWVEPDFKSGLIARCRNAWNVPLRNLTNGDLATLLTQRIATKHILPIAEERMRKHMDDDSEMYEGQLKEAVELVKKDG